MKKMAEDERRRAKGEGLKVKGKGLKAKGEGRKAKGERLKAKGEECQLAIFSCPSSFALHLSPFFRLLSFALRLLPFALRHSSLLRLFAFCLCAFMSLCLPPSAFPEKGSAADIEYAVKAGFIYSFTKFTQWPESAFTGGQDEFVIGVIGDDPFGNTLDALASQKKVHSRRVVIKRFTSLDEIAGCQILFISSSLDGSLEKILARVGNKPVLLVGDTEGFAEKGVDVNFFIQEKKVRFEFNLKALDRAGIKVSSQLLNLGKIIE